MRTVAIIQARMGSSRLPGKILMPIGGVPMLERTVNAARAVPGIDAVIVATTDNAQDNPVAEWCAQSGVEIFRGSETDVLDRFSGSAKQAAADVVVRLTADCPFLDPAIVAETIALHRIAKADYASNVAPPSWPDGLDCEVMTSAVLDVAAAEAIRTSDREHVTPFIRANRHRFKVVNLPCPIPGVHRLRWTVDTQEDLERAERLVGAASAFSGKGATETLRWTELLHCDMPQVGDSRAADGRNEGYRISLTADQKSPANRSPRSYKNSMGLLERAEKTIPTGAQTFSKSRYQFPVGAAPLFLTAGQGGRVWDVDGNEYVDMVNGLLCVSLGYCDPDVDAAVRAQMDLGVSFSLATELEAELSERLVDIIPAAESVRFTKNGSDATSAAVRIVRAATGRNRIISCGYHGWHDWYIGATARSLGVPEAVRDLTSVVAYNDLDAVEAVLTRYPNQIAGLIMEPANITEPDPGYLADLKELLHRHGAYLVFDEVITGFRFSLGGAQELFGVTPDLACFGKGMANGLPLSAVVGRSDLMAQFEHIFVSGTFGGEALSLAAAIAVVDKMRREPVIETINRNGGALGAAVEEVISSNGLGAVMKLKGFDPWRILMIQDQPGADAMAIKTVLISEMCQRGVLTLGSHNMSYAHSEADLRQVVQAYREVLPIIADKLARNRLVEELSVPPLVPVFKVR